MCIHMYIYIYIYVYTVAILAQAFQLEEIFVILPSSFCCLLLYPRDAEASEKQQQDAGHPRG